MSGAEITSSNDDASFAKANRKQLLADTGTLIESATKQGTGQLAYSTDSSAGHTIGTYLCTNETNTVWARQADFLNWNYKYGSYYPVSSTFSNNVDGTLKIASTTGSLGLASLTSNGLAGTFQTGASAGNQSGINMGLLYTRRSMNPAARIWVKLDANTLIRFYAGWLNSTSLTGNTDDPLNATYGFGIGKTTTQTNFRCMHNDNAGSTISDDTGIVADTNDHKIDMYADDNTGTFYLIIDGSLVNTVTTDIPSQTTGLSFQITYTTTTAAARTMSIFNLLISSSY